MFCCRISVFNCPSYLFITRTEVTPVKSWSTSSLSALHTLLSRTQQTDFWGLIDLLYDWTASCVEALLLWLQRFRGTRCPYLCSLAPYLSFYAPFHSRFGWMLKIPDTPLFGCHTLLTVSPLLRPIRRRGAYRWWPHITNCGYFRSPPIHSQKSLSLLSIQDQWERYILNCPAEVWSQAGLRFANLYPLYEKCERSLGGSMAWTAHRAPR